MAQIPFEHLAKKVLPFIVEYYERHSYMPTVGEIADAFINEKTGRAYSKMWAMNCLRELEKQGHISVTPKKRRGITLLAK